MVGQEDAEEICVHVKIRQNVMESVARANVLVDVNVLHVHVIVGALNLAAQRDASHVVADVDVECN
jgi:hypothetical protein